MIGKKYRYENHQKGAYAGKQRVEKTNGNWHDIEMSSETLGESESRQCSVASTRNFSAAGIFLDNLALSEMDSDCQSSHVCGKSKAGRLCSQEQVSAQVHEVELYAYFSVLRVLYASGPLSWEQEALLTNLRLSLNISNDEHLTELKRLFSSETL